MIFFENLKKKVRLRYLFFIDNVHFQLDVI